MISETEVDIALQKSPLLGSPSVAPPTVTRYETWSSLARFIKAIFSFTLNHRTQTERQSLSPTFKFQCQIKQNLPCAAEPSWLNSHALLAHASREITTTLKEECVSVLTLSEFTNSRATAAVHHHYSFIEGTRRKQTLLLVLLLPSEVVEMGDDSCW